jgi:hypothetical protein
MPVSASSTAGVWHRIQSFFVGVLSCFLVGVHAGKLFAGGRSSEG